jgi:hypothetical protein
MRFCLVTGSLLLPTNKNQKEKQIRMIMKNLMKGAGLILIALFILNGCSEEKNARLQVWLTDAPGDYQEVNIDIQGVEIHSSDENTEKGWKALEVNTGVYDLLKLTDGLDTLLGEIEIPAGNISQIRLKLGNDNTIKVDDETYNLTTPSGQQSGLKLQVHEILQEGITYKILLDFDVARSIVETGASQYKLKPVIRTITEAQDGAIKGIVEPIDATPAVYAIVGTDTVGTTYCNEAGEFLIRGLPEGSYLVSFQPKTGYSPKSVESVEVEVGAVTDLETITIVEE